MKRLIGRALYLPEAGANDPARRHAAGVPAETVFAAKPQLGRQMPARAFAAEVPFRWVSGDSVYGADHALRRCIERRGCSYVLAVTRSQLLGFNANRPELELILRPYSSLILPRLRGRAVWEHRSKSWAVGIRRWRAGLRMYRPTLGGG